MKLRNLFSLILLGNVVALFGVTIDNKLPAGNDLSVEEQSPGFAFTQTLPAGNRLTLAIQDGIKITLSAKDASPVIDYIQLKSTSGKNSHGYPNFSVENHGRIAAQCDVYSMCKIIFVDQK